MIRPAAARSAPSPGGSVVQPLDWLRLGHEVITQTGKLELYRLLPLEFHYREALRWRLDNLLPVLAGPAYRDMWRCEDADRRLALYEALYQSGDYHYGDSEVTIRQTIARWLHARLMPRSPAVAEREGASLKF